MLSASVLGPMGMMQFRRMLSKETRRRIFVVSIGRRLLIRCAGDTALEVAVLHPEPPAEEARVVRRDEPRTAGDRRAHFHRCSRRGANADTGWEGAGVDRPRTHSNSTQRR
ncbi:MAG: hypothetical protein ACE5FA_07070 [Dehalococcoidia bacterium]